MLNRYLTFYNSGKQFIVFLVILSMSLVIGGFAIQQISEMLTGISLDEMNSMTDMTKEVGDKMKIINAVFLAFLLLLPSFLFAYLAFPSPVKYLGLKSKTNGYIWIWAIILFACALPFTSLLEQWNGDFSFLSKYKTDDERISKMYVAMLQGSHWSDLLLNTLAICIAPAIIEEVFFRGCLQQLFANWLRKNQWIGIVLVAIVFSAFHGQMNAFLPRFFMGLLLGIIYHYTSNLWITIVVHFLNNFMTILMMYLFNSGISKMNPLEMGDVSILVGLASGIITLAVAYYLYSQRKPFVISEVEKETFEIDM